eukprot:gene8326-14290_t
MLMDAFMETTPEVPIQYRCDGKLFISWRLQAVTKVSGTVIRDILFADDCALRAGYTQQGQRLQAEENFTYLGSTLSSSANNDAEVNNRIAKASSAFGRLRKLAWERRGISQDTKIKVYKAVVLSTPLTDGMKNNYNMFISGAFPASSTSAGNIRFLIQKCWKGGLSQRYHHYA